jgi:hypothetical protein
MTGEQILGGGMPGLWKDAQRRAVSKTRGRLRGRLVKNTYDGNSRENGYSLDETVS